MRTAEDVLLGDVFFCAGQSNMGFSQRQAQGAAEDARAAVDGQIRQLNISTHASLTPRQTFATSVRWVVGSPETVGGFSAACYYFARGLKKTVNVPMGMVVAAWGGARVRNWVSEGELRRASARYRRPRHAGAVSHQPAGGASALGCQMGGLVGIRAASCGPALDAGLLGRVMEDCAAGARRLGVVERHQP